jgi:hypothetical protein
MHHRAKLASAILVACSLAAGGRAAAQSGEGWSVLLDGESLGEWNRVGESNWRAEDRAIVADVRTGEAPAFLVSPESYGDVEIYVEVWASEDANSGIFFRCASPEQITDLTCYEANIFDQRPDPSYGTGAIVRHAEVDPMPKAGGQWNSFLITADGRDIRLEMNGAVTAELRSGLFEEGPIALQYGAGVVKFRKVAVRPL